MNMKLDESAPYVAVGLFVGVVTGLLFAWLIEGPSLIWIMSGSVAGALLGRGAYVLRKPDE